jgi:hypothetical protein
MSITLIAALAAFDPERRAKIADVIHVEDYSTNYSNADLMESERAYVRLDHFATRSLIGVESNRISSQ